MKTKIKKTNNNSIAKDSKSSSDSPWEGFESLSNGFDYIIKKTHHYQFIANVVDVVIIFLLTMLFCMISLIVFPNYPLISYLLAVVICGGGWVFKIRFLHSKSFVKYVIKPIDYRALVNHFESVFSHISPSIWYVLKLKKKSQFSNY